VLPGISSMDSARTDSGRQSPPILAKTRVNVNMLS
jgi:hypothetical protein